MDNYTWTQLKTSIYNVPKEVRFTQNQPSCKKGVVLKIERWCPRIGNTFTICGHFLGATFDFTTFFYLMSHLFLQLGCFCVDYYYYIQSTEFRAHLASTYLNCKLCFYCCIQSWQCTVCCLILCAKSTTKFKMKISKIFGNAHSVVLWILQCAHTLPCIQARGLIQYDMCLYCNSCS